MVNHLTTSRLLLRSFLKSDFKDIHEYASDPEVVEFLPWGPNNEQDTRDFLARAAKEQEDKPKKIFGFAITLKDSDHVIGGCGLELKEHNSGEIGYCLNKKFWGEGYGAESALALLKFGFESVKLHRIFAYCDPPNKASIKVLEKIGMRKEAHFIRSKLVKGGWRDQLLFAILDNEFEGLRVKS